MPGWKEMSNIWNTVRQIDITEIRQESERPLQIDCIGETEHLNIISELLYYHHNNRYGPAGEKPLRYHYLPLDSYQPALRHSDMLLLAIDGSKPPTYPLIQTFNRLQELAIPLLIVVLYSNRLPDMSWGTTSMPLTTARVVAFEQPLAATNTTTLATALLATLPDELHLSASRKLPGIRPIMAHDLVANTSLSNASYTLAAGLPAQIPILSIPFAAADILVLTKNQALMVYKLALSHGAPPDFQANLREIIPVIGSAFLWRQLARSLVGLIPVWGLVPKVAVAYAGTYTIGIAAWRWFATSELVSRDQLKAISQKALQAGFVQARHMLDQTRKGMQHTSLAAQKLFHQKQDSHKTRSHRRWPFARKSEPAPDTTPEKE